MGAPSLQDGIDKAGSPVNLLWKVNPAPWNPENVEPEYAGWRQEQAAWHDGVSLSELSHHMFDTFIEGPDSTRLLAAVSANNYENFAVGQAKQFVPVAGDGNIITDGILHRVAEQGYAMSGIPAAQNWVKYHGEKGGYDVQFVTDPSSAFRGGADPTLFRYQVQGPLAAELVERVFGGPLPPAKFDRFLLEYDDERSGGFEPLRHVPATKTVVLGLVSSKTGALEPADALRRRIDEAAASTPADLALSPQCGFASIADGGNLLTVDEQLAKRTLVADVARAPWG